MSISLCIITRNNESTLRNCLSSVKALVDEIIVVDTGSSDKTLEIAGEFTEKIFDFKWSDNFSEAKNFAIGNATKEWILVLDADETISENDFSNLKSLTEKKEFYGFSLIQRNYTNEIGIPGWISSKNDNYSESRLASGYFPIKMIRLFKNDTRIKFEGAVHDSVETSISKIGKFGETNIPVHHFGLLNRDSNRIKFYIELEKKNYHGGFFQDYQLGSQLNSIGEIDEALSYLKKSVEKNPAFAPSWAEIGMAFLKKGDLNNAKESLLKAESLEKNPATYNYLGILYGQLGDFEKSINCFKKAIIILPENADFHFNLGLTYHQQGMQKEAFFEFKSAIELNPKYKAKVNLG